MKMLAIQEIILDGKNTCSDGVDYGSHGRVFTIQVDDDEYIDFFDDICRNDFNYSAITESCNQQWGTGTWDGYQIIVMIPETVGKFGSWNKMQKFVKA
tara:strand:+ start:309 stop:602 length:294 start_codon:yes stop_codon:yes gene_type:complete